MAYTEEELKKELETKEYEYGFYTDIDSETFPVGLNEEVVRRISQKKKEPEWMTQWRLKAFEAWKNMEEPEWANVQYSKPDYQAISYYSAPKKKDQYKSLDEVDPELLKDSLVIAKKKITDDEIEHILRRTKVVFKLDKNMMQSGLVIQARYHGCMSLINGIRGFKQDQAFGDLIEVSNPESLPEVFEKLRLSLVGFPNRNEKNLFYKAHSWHLENQKAWEAFFLELEAA